MKFSINTKYFLHILKATDRIIDKWNTVPVLQNVYLQTNGKELVVTGTDSNMSLRLRLTPTDKNQLDVQDKDKTGVLIKSYFLKQIVNDLSAKTVSLATQKNHQVTITSGKSHFKIHDIIGSNFPILPKYQTKDMITLPSQKLIQMIKQISFNASEEESRPLLTGVNLTVHDGKLTAVATDSHRIGQETATIKNDKADFEVNIPAKNLRELTRLINKTKTVQIAPQEAQVIFQVDHLTFYSRTLIGNYPKTDGLFKQKYHTTIKVNARRLMDSVQRTSLISHASRNNQVKLQLLSNGQLSLTGDSADVGKNQEEVTTDDMTGHPLNIAFNPDYLTEALKALKNQTVMIRFKDSLYPMEITADTDHDKRFIQLVTPMRVF